MSILYALFIGWWRDIPPASVSATWLHEHKRSEQVEFHGVSWKWPGEEDTAA